MLRKKHFVSILVIFLLCSFVLPLSASAKTPRILMVGDSWAWFMYLNRSLRDALEDMGLGEYEEIGIFTTVPGSEASQWVNPKWLEQVRKELDNYPTIDIIHLSVGGNDFLNNWRIDMPPEAKEALFQQVVRDTETIIRALLDMKPNLHVALIEYDFINKSRGKARCQELNMAGVELSRRRMEMCKNIDRCFYIQTYGLMQYHFGVANDIPPHTVPLPGQYPDYKPFPGGNPDYCNDTKAMMDNVHLSSEGYYYLAKYCIEVIYKQWLTNVNTPITVSKKQ
ncbi:MAG TPA: SGNH/GDSL hydrolase family protein [Candidatus Hydrogenedens sp.]|nr:SGNH/GDSL hydrolase family protein [Candidatus Hydrogenedens sp.]